MGECLELGLLHLLKVLIRPHTVWAGVEAACDFSVLRARHVYVVPVLREWLSWTFVPHLLEATLDNAIGRSPVRACVLGKLTARSKVAVRPTAIGVVIRLLIRTGLPIDPSLQWGLAFGSAKRIDASDAGCLDR